MPDHKVLLAGESWRTVETHVKGFDMFQRGVYEEGADHLREALSKKDIEVEYLPCHEAGSDFPDTKESIEVYDAIILSDIGYSTLAIPPITFDKFERRPNRLELIQEYVEEGGGFLMIGGYMSFQGIKGEGGYKKTPIEEILPVSLEPFDDRVERSEGAVPEHTDPDHPITSDLPAEWPHLLGYNRVTTDNEGKELLSINEDPLLVTGEYGKGRCAAFTSDCAPHWGSPAFTDWDHYPTLWANLASWLSG